MGHESSMKIILVKSGLFRTGRVLEGGFLEAYFWEVQPILSRFRADFEPISGRFRLGTRKASLKTLPKNPDVKTLHVHKNP